MAVPHTRCLWGLVLAGTCLSAVSAHAQDATWVGTSSTEWTAANNWSPNGVPSGTATFTNNNAATSIMISNSTSIGEMEFDADAPAYAFEIDNAGLNNPTFTINDAGIVNNSVFAPTITVDSGASLEFINAADAGNAVVVNNGTTGFNGTSTADGATLYNNGEMIFAGNSTGGAATLIIGTNGVVDFSTDTGPNSNNQTAIGSIQGSGTILLGSTQLTVGANNSSSEYSGAIDDCTASVTCAVGTIATGGQLVKVGTGTLILGGTASTYSGGTIISDGVLQLGDGMNNGTAGTGSITNDAGLAFAEGSAITLSNAISGTGTVTQMGPGTVTVNALNTFSGGTTISAGTIQLGDGINNGTLGTGIVTDNGSLVFAEGTTVTFGNVISGTGTVTQNGPATVIIDEANTNSGGTTIAAGTLQLGDGTHTGTLGTGAVTDNGALVFAEGGDATLTNAIGGSGTVTQNGPGTVTLDAAETYSGLTDVEAGTLVIGDSSTPTASVAGDVEVAPGATLAGFGTIGGALGNNGNVQPGGSSGPLNVTGNYTQSATGNLVIAVTPTSASALKVAGSATLGGTATFVYAPGSYTPAAYNILTATDGISGKFASVVQQGAPASLTSTLVYTPDAATFALTSSAIVQPLDDALFSSQNAILALGAARTVDMLANCQASIQSEESDAAIRPASSCGNGFWIQGVGSMLAADEQGAVPGFHSDTSGGLGGFDTAVAPNISISAAFGYDQSSLHDSVGGEGSEDVLRAGVSSRQVFGPVDFTEVVAYGRDRSTTLRETGVGIVSESHTGNEFDGGLAVAAPFSLGRIFVTPEAGVRAGSFDEGGFSERAAGALAAFAVSGGGTSFTSVDPYADLTVGGSFWADSRNLLTPSVRVGYDYEAGNRNPIADLVAADSTAFAGDRLQFDRGSLLVAPELRIDNGRYSFYFDYTANLSDNWTMQTLAAGLRLAL
jgi:fibronectin-binding autotransporter adhesin